MTHDPISPPTPADKHTNLVNDEPLEAVVNPNRRGQFTFE